MNMEYTARLERLKQILDEGNAVFFGGAGVSTESGIPDFRSADGLYSEKRDHKIPPETILSNHFFKSLFSQQGYLSFTLPVSSNQLLGSKMLVYGGWMILSYAIFMFTGGFLINYAAENVIGQDNIGMIEMFMGMFGNMPSLTQIIAYVVYIIMVFFVIFPPRRFGSAPILRKRNARLACLMLPPKQVLW
jgi:hypothetical protein